MRARIQQAMRYWLLLLGKFVVTAAVTGGLVSIVNRFGAHYYFGYDLLYTTVMGAIFLLACGMAYLSVLDQRYRCRVCLRRLRMPVLTGSWSRMLQFGRPRIEYICIYGHGKLNVEEIQFTGVEAPAWQKHGGMWEELFSTKDTGGSRQ
jgi:hypothetical protein